MAVDLVRLALAFEFRKKLLRRADFNQHGTAAGAAARLTAGAVLKDRHNYRLFERILTMANDRLRETFGMELVMVPYVAKAAAARTAQGRQGTPHAQHSLTPRGSGP